MKQTIIPEVKLPVNLFIQKNITAYFESFDIIFCNHVLEHIEDDAKAISELYRVMKPGGWGILQVPMKNSLEQTYEDFTIKDPKERQKHFGQYDHVRWYGMDYFDRLRKAGFETEPNFYSQKFSEEEIKKYYEKAGYLSCVPRARGDEPRNQAARYFVAECSPRPRG